MSVEVKIVDEYDEVIFRELVKRNLESNGIFIPDWEYRTKGDETFSTNPKKIRVGAFDGERLVGLSWGESTGKTKFMMHMSLVEPDYRGQHIYSRMLDLMIIETQIYDEVDSLHQIFNNHILAIKLRRGFHVVGIDQSTLVGPRIRLRYFHNQKLLELMKFRVGLIEDPRPGL